MDAISFLDGLDTHPAFQAATLLAHDATGRINVAAETELDRRGLGALLVPQAFGGTRPSLPELMLALREVGRHDLALGLGSCLTGLMAASNVWLAGNDTQNRRFGEILRQGGRIAIAYHELAHGNDLQSTQVAAVATRDGYQLSGAKQVINNIDRADGVVLFARTGGPNPHRAHSLFFLERSHLAGPGVNLTSRHEPVGVRGCRIGGIHFDDHAIPASCLFGVEGAGLEYALRAFQVTRTLLPGTGLGAIATAHGLVSRFALDRRLYGMTLLDLPLVQATLVETAGQLWAADCLTRLLAACLHHVPGSMQVYGAVGKYLVPKMMRDVLRRLAETLGARFFLRGGDYGMLEKIVRDYPIMSFGHAGTLLCQATVVPFLPRVLGRCGDGLPLADLDDPARLPPFRVHSLQLAMPAGDPVLDTLPRFVAAIDAGTLPVAPSVAGAFRTAAEALIAERTRLATNLAPAASAAAGDDVRRYGLMLAATAVLLRRIGHDPSHACTPGAPDIASALSLTALSGLLLTLNLDHAAAACACPTLLGTSPASAIVGHLTILARDHRGLI
jgi:alkylation response protein AidB-like acyl-CoA dehydrogenase